MTSLQDLLNFIEQIAPARFAYEWDKIGLQIKSNKNEVSKIVVSLDPSKKALQFAADQGAEVFISHHPLIWEPVKQIHSNTPIGDKLKIILQNNISCIAAHTNWDAAPQGINDTLAEILDLQNILPYGDGARQKWFGTYITTPKTHIDPLLDALDKIGVGTIKQYKRCAFTFDGTGTFEPMQSATPHIGQVGQRESVDETSIFTIIPSDKLKQAEEVLNAAHPYETPFISFIPLHDNYIQPLGRIGKLKQALDVKQFVSHIDQVLSTRCLVWGEANKKVQTIALIGGAASKEWKAAQAAEADLFITGEVGHASALEASESGFLIVQAGHYATEAPGCIKLTRILQDQFPSIEVLYFTPRAGTMGRPH